MSHRPLRLGLIGCGRIVRDAHALAYRSLGEKVIIVSLADVSEASLQVAGELFGVSPSMRFQDYRDMLDRAELDAVVIATPHHLHSEQAVAAAQAGLAVICEKPLAPSLDEASAILDAAESYHVALAVIHNFLFTPAMKTALGLLRDKAIGSPMFSRALSLFRKPKEDMNPGAAWRASKEAGGGCFNDTAYHEVYLVEALVGSPIRAVEARVQSAFFGCDIDDLVLLLCEHDNGAVSTVVSSWGVPGGGASAEVHGPAGSLRVVRRGQELFRFFPDEGQWRPVPLPEMENLRPAERKRIGHIMYFRETIQRLEEGDARLPVTGEMGWHNLAIIEAARRAHRERRAVEVSHRR